MIETSPVQISPSILFLPSKKVPEAILAWIKNNSSKIPMFGDMTINMQCDLDGQCGVYVCFEPKSHRPLYVGKATSRSFLERVPSHCDPREESWFGTMTSRVLKYKHTRSRIEASNWLRRNTKVCLLPVSGECAKADTARIETLLRRPSPIGLEPAWNTSNPKNSKHEVEPNKALVSF